MQQPTTHACQIQPEEISQNALKVIGRLESHGFEAYLVGGSVRDFMLGTTPKDFDVATDARPEEVQELFRNSRIVGRRFRINHVRFGREIIEVATFRAHHDRDSHEDNHTDAGLILRDNVYGSLAEDAQRRDFTVNALYYEHAKGLIHDHVEGLADMDDRVIRLIGDPESRYREDPVRMLRAIRFAAKLDFRLAPETAAPIRDLSFLLKDVPPARVFDEVVKLLMAGFGQRSYPLLREYGLLPWVFHGASAADDALAMAALESTDSRIDVGLPVTPAFLFAAILWPPFAAHRRDLIEAGVKPAAATHEAGGDVVRSQAAYTSVPRRYAAQVREIWELQFRLAARGGRRAAALHDHRRFRAAYDFLILREAIGEELDDLGTWWTDYQEADEESRAEMARSVSGPRRARRRRRGKRKA